MPFARPTLSELVERVSADLGTRLALESAVLRRSQAQALARAEAAATHLLHGHVEWVAQQILPDTASTEVLERWASLFGLTRLAPTYATGNVTVSGTDSAMIASGTGLQRGDGVEYVATGSDVAIAGGTATVPVTALVAGEDGNATAGMGLTMISPVLGVSAAAVVAAGGLTGGAGTETDAALRERLLARMRQPPHGGAEADYLAWAKEVAGVSRAWVYPLELGAGTLTVRFVRDDDLSLIPDAAEVAAVQAYIDARRPVTAAVTVVAPIAVPLNFQIDLTPDDAATRAAVEAELRDLLRRDATPGGTILVSQIRVAVGAAASVTDFTVVAPAANVTHTTGQIAVMGTITWV